MNKYIESNATKLNDGNHSGHEQEISGKSLKNRDKSIFVLPVYF